MAHIITIELLKELDVCPDELEYFENEHGDSAPLDEVLSNPRLDIGLAAWLGQYLPAEYLTWEDRLALQPEDDDRAYLGRYCPVGVKGATPKARADLQLNRMSWNYVFKKFGGEKTVDQINVAMKTEINKLVEICHTAAKESGWWTNIITGKPLKRNDGELICLMHSELSEALEGLRKNKMDEHLPHRKSVEVELADTLIRIFDYAGARGLDLGGAVAEKLDYNRNRLDHKLKNRAKEGGKIF